MTLKAINATVQTWTALGLMLVATAASGCEDDMAPSTPVAGGTPTPVAPTPVAPTPTMPTPVAPTPTMPTPVAPTPTMPTEPTMPTMPTEPTMPAMDMPGQPTFTAIYTEILTDGSTGNCMAGFCHGGPPGPGNGNLEIVIGDKEGTYNNLVNATSSSDMCGGMTLVVPNDSANSLLVQKLGETPPCGMRMPIGPYLNEAQMNQIKMWIDMGAPNN